MASDPLTLEQRRERRRALHTQYLRKHCGQFVQSQHGTAETAEAYAVFYAGRVDLLESDDWPPHSEAWPLFLRSLADAGQPLPVPIVEPFAYHVWTVGPFTFAASAGDTGEPVNVTAERVGLRYDRNYAWPVTLDGVQADALTWARGVFATWSREEVEIII